MAKLLPEEDVTIALKPYVPEPAAPSEHDEIREAIERELTPRERKRPSLDHLTDAIRVVDGETLFLADKGDRVVVENWATVLPGTPWLNTRVYVVLSIDDVTGLIKLYDPECHQHSMTNYLTSPVSGAVRIKLAPAKGNPLTPPPDRPEKILRATDGETLQPKRRGRPKGSKNKTDAE